MGFLKYWFLQILGCQKPCPYLCRLQPAFVCLCIPIWLDLLRPPYPYYQGWYMFIPWSLCKRHNNGVFLYTISCGLYGTEFHILMSGWSKYHQMFSTYALICPLYNWITKLTWHKYDWICPIWKLICPEFGLVLNMTGLIQNLTKCYLSMTLYDKMCQNLFCLVT